MYMQLCENTKVTFFTFSNSTPTRGPDLKENIVCIASLVIRIMSHSPLNLGEILD